MTSQNFCTWLQGFVDLTNETPTDYQWNLIKEKLSLATNTPSLKPIHDLTFPIRNDELINKNTIFGPLYKLGDFPPANY